MYIFGTERLSYKVVSTLLFKRYAQKVKSELKDINAFIDGTTGAPLRGGEKGYLVVINRSEVFCPIIDLSALHVLKSLQKYNEETVSNYGQKPYIIYGFQWGSDLAFIQPAEYYRTKKEALKAAKKERNLIYNLTKKEFYYAN